MVIKNSNLRLFKSDICAAKNHTYGKMSLSTDYKISDKISRFLKVQTLFKMYYFLFILWIFVMASVSCPKSSVVLNRISFFIYIKRKCQHFMFTKVDSLYRYFFFLFFNTSGLHSLFRLFPPCERIFINHMEQIGQFVKITRVLFFNIL